MSAHRTTAHTRTHRVRTNRELDVSGFEGKVAIVTGGGSGLGEAIAKRLAASSVQVVVSDIKLADAERVVV